MKLLLALAFPLTILSCSDLDSEGENEETIKKPEPEEVPEVPLENPAEKVDDGMELAVPKTTEELLTEDAKKTVIGPVPVNVPEPKQDSTIDVKPSIPSEE